MSTLRTPTSLRARRLRAAAAGALVLPLLFPVAALGETLTDALVAAYVRNPTLNAQRAALRAVDENVPVALSGYRPTATLDNNAGIATRDTTTPGAFGATTGSQDLQPRSTALSIIQPLYRGGRTVAGVRQAESQVRGARADLQTTEQSVLLTVVGAYLNVLRDEAVVQLNRNNEIVLQRQLQATRDRFEVGEVTRTDVAQAEARVARTRSDRILAEGNLTSSRATYARVVGLEPGELAPAPALADLPTSLDDAIGIAVEENPALRSSTFAEAASRAAVEVAQGRLLPTVQLEGNLAYNEEQQTRNSETESASLLARLTIPLYQSGAEYAQVRQAKEVNSQRRIQVEEARRQVVENVTTAWQRYTTASARIVSQQEQVRAADTALEGVRQEAEVGARTTLDVLDAEQELLNARVALVGAQRDEYVAANELKAAVGRLTAAALALPVERYDAEDHYRRVRDKWIGLDPNGNGLPGN